METKTITDKKGRKIEIRCELEGELFTAYHEGQKIGGIHFALEEGPTGGWVLKVTNMHLEDRPGYTRCGIGTEIVRMAQDMEDAVVTFGREDGVKSEDGSHLTGSGPAFAHGIGRKRGRDGRI